MLSGVSSSCPKNGRSTSVSILLVLDDCSTNILAADVSTLGGIARPGFEFAEVFGKVCLYGILPKLVYGSGGGEASQDILALPCDRFC